MPVGAQGGVGVLYVYPGGSEIPEGSDNECICLWTKAKMRLQEIIKHKTVSVPHPGSTCFSTEVDSGLAAPCHQALCFPAQ